MPWTGSFEDLLAYLRQFANVGGTPADYDLNGVVHLLLATLDNLRRYALEAELEDIGLVRMLSPEQLERKVEAVFGEKWGRLNGDLAMLYGGIDSKEVTERASDPSGAMGAIQRLMSNDVACKEVAKDFRRPANERKLFLGIEPTVLPGKSDDDDKKLREAMAYLHAKILGRPDDADSDEVSSRMFDAEVLGLLSHSMV